MTGASNKEIIEAWSELLEGEEGDLVKKTKENAQRAERVKGSVDRFIQGDSDRLRELEKIWEDMHAAGSMPFWDAETIWEENETESLVSAFKDIAESNEYDSDWEDRIHGMSSNRLGELFGYLHAEDKPIANSRLVAGLEFFEHNFSGDGDYDEKLEAFDSFRQEYLDIAGYVLEDEDVPLTIEIDQLFYRVDEAGKLVDESEGEIENFYQMILNEDEDTESNKNNGGSEPLSELVYSPTFSLEGRPDGLYFEDWEDIRNQIEASLNSGKNIILNGPPGTGKTKIAKWVCEQVTEKESKVDGYEFTTATADWTAFDTIGGYVPSTEENDEELQFEPRIFLNRFRDENGVKNEWLLIDEINRSDIDKAFGQLFSVLSEDSVTLPYERDDTVELVWTDDEETAQRIENNPDKFPVTESWRLLATMNTHDKASLYEMSYAFMRRFNFIHIGVPDVEESLLDPDEEDNFSSKWIDEGISEDTIKESYEDVTKVWEKVNEQKEIGPSIVRDIFSYLDQYPEDEDDERALTNAVVSLVFPQMEGMRRDEQVGLVDSLSDIDSIDDEILIDRAEDIFRRDFSQDD